MTRLYHFFIIVLLIVLSGCSEYESPQKQLNGLIYCIEEGPNILNPQLVTSAITDQMTTYTVYNRLVEFQPGGTEIIPGIAESWEVLNQGKEYRFKLRKDVYFHEQDGFQPSRPLNAEDIVFSFQRQIDKSHPYHFVNGGQYPYFTSFELSELISSIQVSDPYTLSIHLKQPESPFLYQLAMGFASIISKEYGDYLLKVGTPEKMDTIPVGTGPFIFQKFKLGSYLRFKKNTAYFKGGANIDTVIYAITQDPALSYARLISGDCDIMNTPHPNQVALLKQNPEVRVLETPGLNVGYWSFNVNKPPFDNVLVRKALNHAINKEQIVKTVYNELAQIAKNPIPPSMWGYNEQVVDYEYNPEIASLLLEKAGIEPGWSFEILVPMVTKVYNPNSVKTAELIKFDLQQVGINVSIVPIEWNIFLKRLELGEHDSALQGWIADTNDPDNFFTPLLSCHASSNRSNWCNQEFDALIKQAKLESNRDARITLYRKAQVIFKDDTPWLPIAHSNQYKAIRKDIKGFEPTPFGSANLDNISRER
jgi:dipeptide transport system substrate-binding protein